MRHTRKAFWLGTHHPHWLGRVDVPLFISRRQLERYKTFPRALGPWALDSGGYTEISKHGTWTITPKVYAAFVQRAAAEVGGMSWAVPMDWTCTPDCREKSGFKVEHHQTFTVINLLALREVAPDVHWVPMLQGWNLGSYFRHFDMYTRYGIDLSKEPLVGIGSIAARQHTEYIASWLKSIVGSCKVRLHGFGMKMRGLRLNADNLVSADSMSWSFQARKNPGIPGHKLFHETCANCPEYALAWRQRAVNVFHKRPAYDLADD